MKSRFSRTGFGGFTIVELLVVIAIIVLLNGIILNNFTSARAKARDAKRVSDLGQVQLALALYFDRCKAYPDPTISGSQYYLSTATANGCPTSPVITFGTYMSVVPTPTSEASQTTYDYVPNTARTDYVLHAKLEKTNQAVKDAISSPPSVGANGWPSYTFTGSGTQPTCGNDINASLDYCIGPN